MQKKLVALPEANISPENRPLEKEIPVLETFIFRGEHVSLLEGNWQEYWICNIFWLMGSTKTTQMSVILLPGSQMSSDQFTLVGCLI